MTKLKGTPIPDDFELNETTIAWLNKRHPRVDHEIAVERFLGWACNYSYQNHQRTFQNFVNRLSDDNKLGPLLKKSPITQQDVFVDDWNKWLNRGAKVGLPMPTQSVSRQDYMKQVTDRENANVSALSDALNGKLKRV